MKKVAIITGITSFLGINTASYLIKKGYIVFGIIRPDSQNKKRIDEVKGIIPVEIDFDNVTSTDFNNFATSIDKDKLEVIKKNDITFIHFGWGATLDRTNFMQQMLNVDYSMKVLELAKMLGAKRFIFAGSQAEISKTTPYGLAKKKFADNAIKYLKNVDMHFIHFRIFSMYGRGDRENSLIMQLVKACREHKDIDLSMCDFKWNFLLIDDFVDIIFKFMKKDAPTGTYDIASDDTRILKDYCLEVKDIFASDITLNFGKREKSGETFSLPNITKMLSVIGNYKFTTFKDGILSI